VSRSPVIRLPAVLGTTARTIPTGVIVIALLAAVPTIVLAATGRHNFSGALSAASLIAGAGVGFAADDPAAPTLASSPTTLVVRRSLRALLTSAALVAGWLAALLVAHRYGSVAPDTAAALAELCATGAVSAGFACRTRTDAPISGGAISAAASLLAVITISAFAYRWPALPALGSGPSHGRWWWLAALGAAAAGWSSRDPATRRQLGR
jgi:hypothetical protein